MGEALDLFFPQIVEVKGRVIGYTCLNLSSDQKEYLAIVGSPKKEPRGSVLEGRFLIEGFHPSDLGREVEGYILQPWIFSTDSCGGGVR